MSNEPVGSKLQALLNRIKFVETQLDAATGALEEFQEKHAGSNFLETDEFLLRVKREEFSGAEWTQTFNDILDHKPLNFNEFKYKTLLLVDYIKNGLSDPNILLTIEADLKAFSIEPGVEALTEAISKDGSKLTLLLIDDDYVDRILLKEALSVVKSSLDFVELEDGSNVIEVIKRDKPSATLLDIRMPIIDGFDVLNLIRNDNELAQHPVWMLSTSSEETDIKMAKRLGANGYYSKPDSMDEYSKLATRILEEVAA